MATIIYNVHAEPPADVDLTEYRRRATIAHNGDCPAVSPHLEASFYSYCCVLYTNHTGPHIASSVGDPSEGDKIYIVWED